jgi:glutaredoxin-like protein NrdH
MNVTVYTQAECQPCKLTGMKMRQQNIAFDSVRIDQDEAALDLVKSMGFGSAPVIVVDLGDGATWSWSGYRPDEIEKLEKVLAGADPDGVVPLKSMISTLTDVS